MQNDLLYRKLADHLDRLPDGFPPSETGADLRLLERLFTPEEAALAVHLTLEHEPAQVIASRASLPVETVQPRLDEMALKGLVLSSRLPEGGFLYQALPMVVGIYELQINRMSPDLLQAFRDYWSTTIDRPRAQTIPQMRTIPIGESIARHPEALPYEQVGALVSAQDRFAVTNCICRHTKKMQEKGCQAPEESCLIFGDWADFYVRTGRGRPIDRPELMAILARADKANLVLQPSNSREIEFICCCCGVLRGLKSLPRPADVVASAYIAQLDSDTCQGCWTCLDRCQMEALSANAIHAVLKPERCIGCGLCVTTCPSGALELVRKPASALTDVPATFDTTWNIIVNP